MQRRKRISKRRRCAPFPLGARRRSETTISKSAEAILDGRTDSPGQGHVSFCGVCLSVSASVLSCGLLALDCLPVSRSPLFLSPMPAVNALPHTRVHTKLISGPKAHRSMAMALLPDSQNNFRRPFQKRVSDLCLPWTMENHHHARRFNGHLFRLLFFSRLLPDSQHQRQQPLSPLLL